MTDPVQLSIEDGVAVVRAVHGLADEQHVRVGAVAQLRPAQAAHADHGDPRGPPGRAGVLVQRRLQARQRHRRQRLAEQHHARAYGAVAVRAARGRVQTGVIGHPPLAAALGAVQLVHVAVDLDEVLLAGVARPARGACTGPASASRRAVTSRSTETQWVTQPVGSLIGAISISTQ